MYPYLGDFPTGQTIYIPFHTFDSNDPSASVTITGLATTDIEVYKNGSVTQRSSDSGYTLLDTDGIDFDGITGIHGISIDTSDNTDAGFWAAGNDYWVIISSVTVDAATINFIAATFSIDNRGLLRPTTAQRTLDVTATGAAGIDWANVEGQGTSVDLSATSINLTDTTTTVTNDVGVNEWNGVALGTTNPLPNAAAGAAGGLPTDSTGKTSFNDVSAADVNAQCDTALSDIGLDHLISSALPTNWATDVASGSVFDNIADDGTAAFDRTTDSLQAIADSGGGGPTAAQIADAVWDEAQADHVGVGTFGVTASEIADILADTNELQTDDVPGLIAALNDISTAQVNTEVDTALADIGLDHLISSALPTNWATDVAAGSVFDNIADDGTAAFDRTTDSLQAIADSGGGGPTAAQIADAVWDEAQADHATAATFGEIATEIANILADTNELQTDDVPGLIAALNDPDAPAIASAVWEASQAAHTSAGTFGVIATEIADILTDTAEIGAAGAGLTEAGGTGDQFTAINVASISNDAITSATFAPGAIDTSAVTALLRVAMSSAVWERAQSAHTSAGTFGEIATEIANILTDTGEIGTAGAGLSNIPWNASWDAEVESEVNDALDTTISELGVAKPSANPTIRTALMLLYMAFRNRRDTTSSADLVYNDAGTVITSAAVSDDTVTFTKGEFN